MILRALYSFLVRNKHSSKVKCTLSLPGIGVSKYFTHSILCAYTTSIYSVIYRQSETRGRLRVLLVSIFHRLTLQWCVYCPLKDQVWSELYIKNQFVPRSKHTPSRLHVSIFLVLFRSNVSVCSEVNIKHTKTVSGQIL